MRWTTITVFSNVSGPATRTPSRPSSSVTTARCGGLRGRSCARSTAADEVVQETWLAVVRGLSAFEGRSSLRTWIFRILVNRARTRAVRDARSIPFSALESDDRPTVEPAAFAADGRWISAPPRLDADPESGLLSAELREHLLDAVDDLSPAQRAVITLRDLVGVPAAGGLRAARAHRGQPARAAAPRARPVRAALVPLMEVSR